MEQLVARWAHNPKVIGSSPVPATFKNGNRKFLLPFFISTPLTPDEFGRYYCIKQFIFAQMQKKTGNKIPVFL